MERRTMQGTHFIRVKGNNIERVRAHIKLMSKEIPTGPIPFLAHKNEWLIRRGNGLLKIPAIQEIAVLFYRNIVVPLLAQQLTSEEKEALWSAHCEANIPYEKWRESLLQADAFMVLARTSVMKHLLPEWIPGALPGCTSAVALRDWTESGRVLACRNFDYFVVGPWETHSTVVFNEPSEKDYVPYVSLTAAGVSLAGVTAINREGITLSTHAHFGRDVNFMGRPIVLLGDEVIRRSKNLDQAIDIIRKSKPCANWTFVMSSAAENRGVAIEMTPKKVFVREAQDGFLAHTNYFHSPEIRQKEALLCGSYCEDLEGRICQIKKILGQFRGKLRPEHMSVALGDHHDPFTDEERVFGNTLSVVTTVKSVVFDPGAQKFWIATRKESPVSLGEYMEVDMDRFWKVSQEEYEQSMSVLPHYQPKTPGLKEAVHHYREAYRSYHTECSQEDYQERALAHLKRSLAAYSGDGHVWVQAGIVALSLRRVDEARSFLEGSLKCAMSEHVTGVRDLYLARCYDLLGMRDRAIEIYGAQRNIKEPKLRKAIQQGLKKSYKKWETSFLQVDLQYPDTFHY